jgi:hypothetical protein
MRSGITLSALAAALLLSACGDDAKSTAPQAVVKIGVISDVHVFDDGGGR